MLLVGQAGACFEWICGTMPGPDLPNDWIFDPNGWEWFHPTNSRSKLSRLEDHIRIVT